MPLLLAAAGLAGCGGGAEAQAEDVVQAFLADTRSGAWNAAYSRLHPELQSACGSAESFKREVEDSGRQPRSWTVGRSRVFTSSGTIDVTMTTAAGDENFAGLELEKRDGQWRIRGWQGGGTALCRAQ